MIIINNPIKFVKNHKRERKCEIELLFTYITTPCLLTSFLVRSVVYPTYERRNYSNELMPLLNT